MRILASVVIVLAWAAFAPRAQAQLVASEDFSYAPGALNGQNGGVGFSNPWFATGQFSVNSSEELSFTGFGGAASRSFAPIDISGADSIYVAFHLRYNSPTSGPVSPPVFYVSTGLPGGTTGWTLGVVGTQFFASGGANAGTFLPDTDYLIVSHILRGAGSGSAADTLRMWINPVSEFDAPLIERTTLNYLGDGPYLGGLNLTGAVETGSMEFGNFALGTTFDAVLVPEPGTWAMVGLLGVASGWLYRRRKMAAVPRTGP